MVNVQKKSDPKTNYDIVGEMAKNIRRELEKHHVGNIHVYSVQDDTLLKITAPQTGDATEDTFKKFAEKINKANGKGIWISASYDKRTSVGNIVDVKAHSWGDMIKALNNAFSKDNQIDAEAVLGQEKTVA